jgi:photosystem II stability/assembly factor-like uncharacterized protein
MQLLSASLVLFVAASVAMAQSHAPASAPNQAPQVWQMQDSGTTAGMRGIDSVDGTVAWASGTEGTVLKTTDGGAHWQKCAVPDADKYGATLDFRGVQAWDAMTAIVMASGPGNKSRLYKTTDGCKIWTLLFTNPETDGFYDALLFVDRQHGLVLGDPARGDPRINPAEGGYFAFRIRVTYDAGETWAPVTDPEAEQPGKNLQPLKDEAFFAASNSSMIIRDGSLLMATSKGRVLRKSIGEGGFRSGACAGAIDPFSHGCGIPWTDLETVYTPMAGGNASTGIFSIASRASRSLMVVGGDYTKPDVPTGTAAWSNDGGKTWTASTTPPHGYRSTVQWSESLKLWIAAGTNGSDISRDDGRTWQPLDNGNWNALSLPFIVGPKGRIARLNPSAIPAAK